MPLIRSASNAARSKNITAEIRTGKYPLKQAIAIGYSEQRAMRKKKADRWATGKRKSPP